MTCITLRLLIVSSAGPAFSLLVLRGGAHQCPSHLWLVKGALPQPPHFTALLVSRYKICTVVDLFYCTTIIKLADSLIRIM